MFKSRSVQFILVLLIWTSLTGSRPIPQPSFLTQRLGLAAPTSFGKLSPNDNAINQPVSNLTLRWQASSPGVTYQYCVRPNKSACQQSKWISVGANTSVIRQSLTANTTYYWQVRAVDASGNTYADGDATAWWQFKTVSSPALPGPFSKVAPADDAIAQPINGLTLSWAASSLATSYQYCVDLLNNNVCDNSSWTNASGLSANLGSLAYDTTYYWQVRAVNGSGNVEADLGTWWSFHTQINPPGTFGKTSPANFAVSQPINITLTWLASSGSGLSYEYCIATAPCASSSPWVSVGTSLSANPAALQYATTYYWQIRAVNTTASTYADNGTSWSFTTLIAPPSDFTKSSPGNNLLDRPLSLTLSWGASAGSHIYYEYCLATSTCTPASTWLPSDGLGSSTSVNISGLSNATIYTWQVRAVNVSGVTYADLGTIWQFTTLAVPPQPFDKLAPEPGATGSPINFILQWRASTGASRYFYCVDTASHANWDTSCGPGWVLSNTTTSNSLSLDYNSTYYWQVYAENNRGDLQANEGSWWSFTTSAAPPIDFSKIIPADGVNDQSLTPWLYWWTPTVPGNTYQYCVYTGDTCPDEDWTSIAENAAIHITTPLSTNTLYNWQVRRVSDTLPTVYVYANSDTPWSFTTVMDPPSLIDPQSLASFSTPESTQLSSNLAPLFTSNYGKDFSLYGNMPSGTLSLQTNGSFTYSPVQYFNGAVTFQFILSDGCNPPAGPFTATVTVTGVNDPPLLDSIPDQAGENGKQLMFYVYATDPDLPYGDHLTFSIDQSLPAGASIDPATGLFNWVVAANQGSNVFNFTVRVTDDCNPALSDTQNVKITITSYFKLFFPIIGQ